MLQEIWKPHQSLLFVGTAVTELSDILGFYHLHPKDRFWELLSIAAITKGPLISAKERKALVEGHKEGSLSDPVRLIFIEKKTGQLRRLGIGLTDLNRRTIAADEKDKTARPTTDDVAAFVARVDELEPKIVAFVTPADVFLDCFGKRYPGVTDTPGLQQFTIGGAEVWSLGSTTAVFRGESLTRQEDAFFALGERIETLRGSPPAK